MLRSNHVIVTACEMNHKVVNHVAQRTKRRSSGTGEQVCIDLLYSVTSHEMPAETELPSQHAASSASPLFISASALLRNW